MSNLEVDEKPIYNTPVSQEHKSEATGQRLTDMGQFKIGLCNVIGLTE